MEKWLVDAEEEKDAEIRSMTVEYSSSLEGRLSNNVYVHGCTYDGDMAVALAIMHKHLKDKDSGGFKGITLEIGANRMSVMSQYQYKAYEKEFGRKSRYDHR